MATEVDIDPELQMRLMQILEKLESGTDLEGCQVISSTGLRVACADRAVTDADEFSVSPATLIKLGQQIMDSGEYGDLTEIALQGKEGYSIITVGKGEFMLLSTCKKGYKLGYYFHRIRKTFRVIEKLLEGVEIKPLDY
ncbi:MAG: hypothetical protein Kow0069_19540 [Promethearchaeota archaeon]